MKKTLGLLRWGVVGGAALGASLAMTLPAQAQVNIFDQDGLTIDVGATAAVYHNMQQNIWFGAGRDPFNTSGRITNTSVRDPSETDMAWQEAYVNPAAYLNYDMGEDGSIYGEFALVAGLTTQEGDPAGFTPSSPTDIDGEKYFLGWRSGTALGDENMLDVSFGMQPFKVGRQFIFGRGKYSAGADALYWLSPRYSFHRAGIVRLNTMPVRADLFWLKTDHNPFVRNTQHAGINLEVLDETTGFGTVAVMYDRILDVDGNPAFVANPNHRDDLNIYNVRYDGNPLESMPNWHFSTEFAWQQSSPDGISVFTGSPKPDVDANAWYAEVGYSFAEMTWTPNITYRFNHYSGDDPNSSEDEAYDALHYGFEGWGTWYHGEVVGEYAIFNTNVDVNMVKITANPYDNLTLGAMWFNFQLDEPGDPFFGTTDEDYANEFDVTADWIVNDNMSISAVYGVAFPGDGATNSVAISGFNASTTGVNPQTGSPTDDNWHVFEVGAWVWF
jgi:hypothetical protein